MSDSATKPNQSKSPLSNTTPLNADELGLILTGVVTTRPEKKAFDLKKGGKLHMMNIEVTDGDHGHLCRFRSDTGEDFPEVPLLQPIKLKVHKTASDQYVGIYHEVSILA